MSQMDTDATWAAIMADPVQTDLKSVFENGLSPTTCMFPVHLLTTPYIEFIKQTVEKHKDDKFYIFCVQTEVIAVAQLHAERIKDQQRTYRQWVLDTIMPSIRNPNEPLEEYAFRMALEVVSNPSYKLPKFNDTPPVVPVKDVSVIDTTEYSIDDILSMCRPSVFNKIKSAFETLVKKIEIISDLDDSAREKMQSFATSETADDLKEGVYGKGWAEIRNLIRDIKTNGIHLSPRMMDTFAEFVADCRKYLNEIWKQGIIFAGLAIIFEIFLPISELREFVLGAGFVIHTIIQIATSVDTVYKGTPQEVNAAPSGQPISNLTSAPMTTTQLSPLQEYDRRNAQLYTTPRAGTTSPIVKYTVLTSTPNQTQNLTPVAPNRDSRPTSLSTAIQANVPPGQNQQTGPVQNMIVSSRRIRNIIEEFVLMHVRNHIITGSSMISLYPSETSQISVPALVVALITALKLFAVVELTYRRELLHSITWTHLVATVLTGIRTIVPVQMARSDSMVMDDMIIPFMSALIVDQMRFRYGKVLSNSKTKKIILTVAAGAATISFMALPPLLSNILFSDSANMTFTLDSQFVSSINNTENSIRAIVSNCMTVPLAGLTFTSLAAACSALNTAGDFRNEFATLNASIYNVRDSIQEYKDYTDYNPNRTFWASNFLLTNPFVRNQYDRISIYGSLNSDTAVDSQTITMLCRLNNFSDNHTRAVMAVYYRDRKKYGLKVGSFYNNPVDLKFLSNTISTFKKLFQFDEPTLALLIAPFAYVSNNTFIGSMKRGDTMKDRFFTTLLRCVSALQTENKTADILSYANAYNAILDCMKNITKARATSIRKSINDENINLTFPTVKEYQESFTKFYEQIQKISHLSFPNINTEFFDYYLSIVLQIRNAANPSNIGITMNMMSQSDYSVPLKKDSQARNPRSTYLLNSDLTTDTDNMLAIYVSPFSATNTNIFCASIPYVNTSTNTTQYFVMDGLYDRINDFVRFNFLPDKGWDLNSLVTR